MTMDYETKCEEVLNLKKNVSRKEEILNDHKQEIQ